MCRSVAAPTSGNRQKYFRHLLDKYGLLFWSEQQIAVAMLRRSQCRKNVPAHAKVWIPHVRTLFRTGHAQRDPPKVCNLH